MGPLALALASHPTRVRGLKQVYKREGIFNFLSHPTRVRGLKLNVFATLSLVDMVAPHAGAWIETVCSRLCN